MSYSGQLYLLIILKLINQIIKSFKFNQHEQRQLKLNQMPDDTFVIIMGSYLYYLEKDIVFENGKIEVIENEIKYEICRKSKYKFKL